MSDSHCSSVGSFPAVKELINNVGPTTTRGPCWNMHYSQNLSQSTYDQTFTTGASRRGSYHPFSSHLHLFDFRFRSVTMSVFRCFCASVLLCFCVSRTDYRAATASGGVSQPEGNDAGTVNGSVVHRGGAFDIGRLPVLQHGRSVFPQQHPGGNRGADSRSTGEPDL